VPIYAPIQSTIRKAADLLLQGDLVAFPTETVYGLGADATNDTAVAAIFAVKRRPQFNPVIVHVPDLAAAEPFVVLDDRARTLAEAFWPGPLTLVLPRRPDSGLSRLVSAGLDTVAIRAPDHRVAQALLRMTNRPVAAPSANPSGRVSPTTAQHVERGLGHRVQAILDGGPCRIGVESTVIGLFDDVARLLRPGGVDAAIIEQRIGRLQPAKAGDEPHSPGMMRAHYAPALPIRIDAVKPQKGVQEALLAFGTDVPRGFAHVLNLSPQGDVNEAAANLFAMLHELDRPDFEGIAVMPIPDHGLGLAINDRLRRAVQ
jgi:L-threonylcarbamoyladenylate synthase